MEGYLTNQPNLEIKTESLMRKAELQSFLDISIHSDVVNYEIVETMEDPDFKRHLIKYHGTENDTIRAYLFIPCNKPIIGSVLVHHQHNGERHLGKSEVAGITGDPFQFFCPELANLGIITLAPDSICFEDRRTNKMGYEPDVDPDDDVLQHYNQMCYRILNGTTLMKKVIEDSSIAISLLSQLDESPPNKIGILGHSYGGNTVIFHSPFDDRIGYTCSSGAVCSYRTKYEQNTGIEMAEVIPGFTVKYDIEDLLRVLSPRHLLIMSASEDIYAQDAEKVYQSVRIDYPENDRDQLIKCHTFPGPHELDQERFDVIIDWFVQNMS